MPKYKFDDATADQIVQEYEGGASLSKLAKQYGAGIMTIRATVLRRGGVMRPQGTEGLHWSHPVRRSDRHNWNGGRKRINGYWAMLVDADDLAFPMAWSGPDPYVLEHRYVMAHQLGRPLTADESVHHIDGNRLNNTPENLQLRRRHHGMNSRYQCNGCGSHDIAAVPL